MNYLLTLKLLLENLNITFLKHSPIYIKLKDFDSNTKTWKKKS